MAKTRRIITNVGNTLWSSAISRDDKDYNTRRLLKAIGGKDISELKKISPEINSLETFGIEKGDRLVFVATNTKDSTCCRDALVEYYRVRGFDVSQTKIENLDNDSNKSFRKGITEYVDFLISLFP